MHEGPSGRSDANAWLADDVAVVRALFEELGRAPDARALLAGMLASLRRHRFAAIAEAPGADDAAVAGQLAAEGMADLGVLVDAARIAEIRAHLDACPLYPGHVHDRPDLVAGDAASLRGAHHYACYTADDIARCPHLIEIANDPRLLRIAEAYLGCPPTIYGCNAWWSFARGGSAAQIAQHLHRDLDDFRFLTLFLYLTPVDAESGPHRYVKFSHDRDVLMRTLTSLGWPEATVHTTIPPLFLGHGYDTSQTADALLGQLAFVWTGPPGSALLADTYGLHMGIPPARGDRLMGWIRYGLGPNIATQPGLAAAWGDAVRARTAPTPRARYVNRLLTGTLSS